MDAKISQKLPSVKPETFSNSWIRGPKQENPNLILPTEMLKKIMEYLDFKSLCNGIQTCKRWKEIIDEFELVKKASSKYDYIIRKQMWNTSTLLK